MFFDDVTGAVGQVTSWVESQWQQRLVQVSVYGGLLFYLLSTTSLIDQVDKTLSSTLGVKFGKDATRAVHGVVFSVLMYLGTRFILDPLVKRITTWSKSGAAAVEGMKNKKKVAPKKKVIKKK